MDNITNQSQPELQRQAIGFLVNPTENDSNVVISRINKKIKSAVGESLYNFYCIQGERGEKKFIKIDRELVDGLEN